jgi:molybdate-binding protein
VIRCFPDATSPSCGSSSESRASSSRPAIRSACTPSRTWTAGRDRSHALFSTERSGVAATSIFGYERQEPTHLAVAASVASGRFDCGLGILAAAPAFGLDLGPLKSEPFDLVLNTASLEDPLLGPSWDLLSSDRFQASVRALAGQDTSETGGRIL